MALVQLRDPRSMLGCMAIRDWPSEERPREKLLEKGAAALSDAELLAILLRTGIAGPFRRSISRATFSRASARCAS